MLSDLGVRADGPVRHLGEVPLMPGFKPMPAGMRFGSLTVVRARGRGDTLVLCRCDCGTERFFSSKRLGHHTNSCGCLRQATAAGLKARHMKAGTKIYNIWSDMVARCNRVTHKRYADYGGRGIAVCERWLTFDNFYADMGERPPGRSLDRRDNDRGYSPANCRWATPAEQRANRRPQRRRTRCAASHPYTEANTRVDAKGVRNCRTCAREYAQRARARRKAAA